MCSTFPRGRPPDRPPQGSQGGEIGQLSSSDVFAARASVYLAGGPGAGVASQLLQVEAEACSFVLSRQPEIGLEGNTTRSNSTSANGRDQAEAQLGAIDSPSASAWKDFLGSARDSHRHPALDISNAKNN